ncbi:MAG TPA: UpxY family transcription antiterminator [bacterium]|nr:UpxY family transcription antiterminator [bacterium]
MQNLSKSIFGELNETPYWYAISTRARHEKKVNQRLLEKQIQSYLPVQKTHRKWSDRYKLVEEPLFSCYVFVRIALKDRLPVLQTDGVVRLVTFNGIPATIPEEQLNAIRTVSEKMEQVQKIDYLTPGKKVEVVQGDLKGLQGILVAVKNSHRLVLQIDSIKQAIAVDIDYRDVRVINEPVVDSAIKYDRLAKKFYRQL